MPQFFVCTTPDEEGRFVLHQDACDLLPRPSARVYLGELRHAPLAVLAAKGAGFRGVRLCPTCCRRREQQDGDKTPLIIRPFRLLHEPSDWSK